MQSRGSRIVLLYCRLVQRIICFQSTSTCKKCSLGSLIALRLRWYMKHRDPKTKKKGYNVLANPVILDSRSENDSSQLSRTRTKGTNEHFVSNHNRRCCNVGARSGCFRSASGAPSPHVHGGQPQNVSALLSVENFLSTRRNMLHNPVAIAE